MSTPTSVLRQFIIECLVNESIIRRDDDGHLVIRKLVKFKKPETRFSAEDNVATDLTPQGNMVVDDMEKWKPDFDEDPLA
jgi:hypothetical protein